MQSPIQYLCAALVIATGLGLTLRWSTDPMPTTIRAPGSDRGPEEARPSRIAPLDLAGAPVAFPQGEFEAIAPPLAEAGADWPGFRGSDRDNIADFATPLGESIEFRELWGAPMLAEGHAGAAIADGRVYVLDYDDANKSDCLRCFELATGREFWRRSYAVPIKRNHGISRTTPAVVAGVCVSLGPKCHVAAVDAASGEYLWGLDLVAEAGAEVPLWYAGQCPLINGDAVILAPGGDDLLRAVDLHTGETRWRTPNPRGWGMSHASITPARLAGEDLYLYCALGGVVGVSTEGEERFAIDWKPASYWVPSAVALDDSRFLVAAGNGAGSRIYRVSREGEALVAVLERAFDNAEFDSDQQTPIAARDRLFTILPKSAGSAREQLVCMDREGNRVWASGKDWKFGLGPFVLIDEWLLVLGDDMTLTLAPAFEDAFRPVASRRLFEGHDAWAPMAISGRVILARDRHTLVAIELGE